MGSHTHTLVLVSSSEGEGEAVRSVCEGGWDSVAWNDMNIGLRLYITREKEWTIFLHVPLIAS